jgi:hypothetical protein
MERVACRVVPAADVRPCVRGRGFQPAADLEQETVDE